MSMYMYHRLTIYLKLSINNVVYLNFLYCTVLLPFNLKQEADEDVSKRFSRMLIPWILGGMYL